jgi:hypothetical protein
MLLIEVGQRVALAHAELQAATDALQVEEQKGSWSDQLDEKIRENAFPSIMGSFLLGDLEFWRKSSRFLLPPNRWRGPLLPVRRGFIAVCQTAHRRTTFTQPLPGSTKVV